MTQATSISRASVPQTSVSDTLKNAVTAAVLTAILTVPLLGCS
jgi:branched-chain amino acid transport system permease protein